MGNKVSKGRKKGSKDETCQPPLWDKMSVRLFLFAAIDDAITETRTISPATDL